MLTILPAAIPLLGVGEHPLDRVEMRMTREA